MYPDIYVKQEFEIFSAGSSESPIRCVGVALKVKGSLKKRCIELGNKVLSGFCIQPDMWGMRMWKIGQRRGLKKWLGTERLKH